MTTSPLFTPVAAIPSSLRYASMILEIAIGVALGLIIFAHWREIASLGALALLFVVLFALLGVTCWLLYAGIQAVKGMPPLLAPDSVAAAAISILFGLLANLLFAFACGHVLEQRTSLRGREAYVLGAILYGLFLVSVMALPVGIEAYSESQTRPTFLFVLLAVSWAFALHQCVRLNRKRKHIDATAA